MPPLNQPIAKRINADILIESLEHHFITAILGARRVGKSTWLQWIMAQHPERQWIVLNMDILSQRDKITASGLHNEIEKKALQKIGTGEKLWVVIDEAQKCPELFEQVKVIYDSFKDTNTIKFVLTGSASLDLHNLSAESLAGRVELLHMREFSIKEAAMYQHSLKSTGDSVLEAIVNEPDSVADIIEQASPYQDILQQALDFQLIFGGLPELMQLETDRERFRYLDQYVQSYLEKDVRRIADITDLPLFQKLLQVLAEHTGSLRDDARLLDALGCARNTLKKYRNYLVATMVYYEVYPVINNSLKRIIKSPKGYVTNNGVLSVLTGLDTLDVLKSSSHIGHRFENWFLKEVQIWLDRDVKRHQIYYWQTITGTEVDFIVEQKPRLIPFEVTYRSRVDSKKLKNLATFMDKTDKASVGVLIYNGEYIFKPELNIHCIPAWAIG